jgi:ABC-type multidrug transport system permease subunit
MNEKRRWTESSLVQLTLVRFREFWREPEAIFWVFIFPILLTAGLGIAFRNQPPDVSKIGAVGRVLVEALRQDKSLAVSEVDLEAGRHALRTGRIVLLATGDPKNVTYIYDNTNPDARTARLLAQRALRRASGTPDPVKSTEQLVQEPGSRYVDFVVPGLLGMNIMGSAMWGLAFSIVDARRKKLLKRLVASPMRRWEYLLSFLLSRLVLLLLEVLVLIGFAVLFFGVPIRGSYTELGFLCVFSSLSFSALGLLVAARPQTIEAASGLMNLIMLPMWILSGVFFSPERFPDAAQPIIRALPLTAVIDALRSNMIQGTPLSQMSWQLAVTAGWLVISFFVALKIFRWR